MGPQGHMQTVFSLFYYQHFSHIIIFIDFRNLISMFSLYLGRTPLHPHFSECQSFGLPNENNDPYAVVSLQRFKPKSVKILALMFGTGGLAVPRPFLDPENYSRNLKETRGKRQKNWELVWERTAWAGIQHRQDFGISLEYWDGHISVQMEMVKMIQCRGGPGGWLVLS